MAAEEAFKSRVGRRGVLRQELCQRSTGNWLVTIVTDEAMPPESGSLKSTTCFVETQEVAERLAKTYLAMSEPVN